MTENAASPWVVVGVDGSEPGDAALRAALGEAAHRGARLVAVWAADPPIQTVAQYYGLQDYDRTALDAAHARAAREHIDTVVGGVAGAAGVAVEVHTASGGPAEVLLEAARGAELLVVGHRGRSGLRAMALGSVTLSCVLHAPCPVLVIPASVRPDSDHAARAQASSARQ